MEMKRLTFLMILFITCIYNMEAQEIGVISGTVMDLNLPIDGATVLITSANEKDIISYAITDKNGAFLLKNIDFSRAKVLTVKKVGYEAQSVQLNNEQDKYDFYLNPKTVDLKEVVVKGTKIRASQDTLTYLTSAFAQKNDITIGDVLKRMPGIEVSNNGHVKYQGREVKDFYVDGSDIMGSRYNMAINSIKHTDVGSVEVMENHQSIKMFEDLLHSGDVALNVKLKEKARNKRVGILEAGAGGTPFRWNLDANTMRFSEKFQSLNTFKSNNIGNSLSSSISSSSFLSQDDEWSTGFAVIPTKYSSLDIMGENRTLFNKSHLLNLNSQFRIGKDITITPQIEVSRAQFKRNSYEQQTFFLDSNTWEVVKDENGKWNEWTATPSVRIEANTKKYYLNNTLTGSFTKYSNELVEIGTHSNKNMSSEHRILGKSKLDLMLRIGKQTIGFHSYLTLGRIPQSLNIDKEGHILNEHIRSCFVFAQNSAQQTFTIHNLTLGWEGGFTVAHHTLKSNLTGLTLQNYNDNQENNNEYDAEMFFLIPSLSLKFKTLKFSLSSPIYHDYNVANDRLDTMEMKYSKWKAGASLSAQWVLSKQWEISGNISYKPVQEIPYNLFNRPIMATYPFLQIGTPLYNEAKNTNARISLRYKNIFSGIFGNVSYMFQKVCSNLTLTQNFEQNYMVYGSTFLPQNSYIRTLTGSVSYMIDPIKGGITLKGIHTSSFYHFLQNNILNSPNITNTQFSLLFFATLFRNINLNYIASLSLLHHEQQNISEESNKQFNQQLSVGVSLNKNVNIELVADHHYKKIGENSKQICLMDAILHWNLSSVWKLKLSATNLLNNKEFINTIYSPTSVLNQRYELRPLTVFFSVVTAF